VQAAIAAKARREIDAAGSLVLPGLFNLHLHSDKSLLGEVMRPNVSDCPKRSKSPTSSNKTTTPPKSPGERSVFSRPG
jgi:cytosine/adenosine deaminase-related metal-dependent hydrolase